MTKFDKYKYLGNVIPEVPETWNNIILNMLHDIDFLVKPRWIPRIWLNSKFYHEKKYLIVKIKQTFGTLRIRHNFIENNIRSIISTAEKACNNTCEFCGKKDTTQVTIKNWVRTLCSECIEKNKK